MMNYFTVQFYRPRSTNHSSFAAGLVVERGTFRLRQALITSLGVMR